MPRILDVFCGAGGCSVGYARAGFDVSGVDLAPQPRYPFPFLQGDALEFLCGVEPGDYDAIHASPPCQAHSTMQSMPNARAHADLIAPVRAELERIGSPYIIENVPGAPLRDPVMLCGGSLGLGVRRHRLFECSFPVMVPPCAHGRPIVGVYGDHLRNRRRSADGGDYPNALRVPLASAAMEIDWMNWRELTQAVPPAYTELIGHQLAGILAGCR
jgi:DNA (cytosine-5)-methyltransferase 1